MKTLTMLCSALTSTCLLSNSFQSSAIGEKEHLDGVNHLLTSLQSGQIFKMLQQTPAFSSHFRNLPPCTHKVAYWDIHQPWLCLQPLTNKPALACC